MEEVQGTTSPKRRTYQVTLLSSIFFLVFGLIIGMLVGKVTSHHGLSVESSKSTAPVFLKPTSSLSVIAKPDFKTSDYVLRQVDMTKPFFDTLAYPAVITGISNAVITPMRCTYTIYQQPAYQGKSIQYFYSTKDSPLIEEKDKVIVQNPSFYMQFFNQLPKGSQGSVKYCETSENNGYSFISTPEYQEVYKITSGTSPLRLVTTHIVFQECNSPLLVTNEGILYYACFGGDTRAHAEIRSVSSQVVDPSPIYECASGEPGPTIEPSTCGTNPQ